MKTVPLTQKLLPKIILAGLFPMPQMASCGYLHRTLALHLYLYEAEWRLDKDWYKLVPGDLTLHPPGIPSEYRVPAAGTHWCIHFTAPVTKKKDLSLPVHLRLPGHTSFLAAWFQRISLYHARLEEGGQSSVLYRSMAACALQELLLWLAASSAAPRSTGPQRRARRRPEEVISLLEERWSQPLEVAALAREVGMSQNYLARQFRRSTGMTLQEYVARRRVEQACHLLSASDQSIKAVAAQVGYPDPHHFNKVFRRRCGQSPSDYRENSRPKELLTPPDRGGGVR